MKLARTLRNPKGALALLGLGAALAFATTAIAADQSSLPKEGTFNGTYTAYGTSKATMVGKERLLAVFDENAVTLGSGLINHMTWHCWGMGDFTNGAGQVHGYCLGTDPVGGQIVVNFGPDEKHKTDQDSWNGSATFTTGTGNYAGISGGWTYTIHVNVLKSLTPGTYFDYATLQGSYKLP
jgi:hypothetical protein